MYNYFVIKKINSIGYLGVAWAVIGLTLIFISAIIRIAPHPIEAIRSGLSFGEWVTLLIWCAFMLFAEGYRGFQKQFSPRFASRALYLFNNPYRSHLFFAPLFCIGYIYATRKRKLSAWLLSLGIIFLVVGVSHIAQPWRGIIDIGVIIGLVYGLVSVHYFCIRAIITHDSSVNPEVARLR